MPSRHFRQVGQTATEQATANEEKLVEARLQIAREAEAGPRVRKWSTLLPPEVVEKLRDPSRNEELLHSCCAPLLVPLRFLASCGVALFGESGATRNDRLALAVQFGWELLMGFTSLYLAVSVPFLIGFGAAPHRWTLMKPADTWLVLRVQFAADGLLWLDLARVVRQLPADEVTRLLRTREGWR